jgi:3'-phosphoadenosine 5'-phosphosulfate sulfotransferase (PAPS reductase)/FAD synthetase
MARVQAGSHAQDDESGMTDPFKINEPTVISFSGGRTSAYMLWRVLQANDGLPHDALVCFANTGKEEELTLEFVRNCGENWAVDIHWLEFRDAEPAFELVTFDTASRNGEPFEALIRKKNYLPNPVARFCTVELKILTMERYLKSLGMVEWVNMVGIRADEQRRVAKIKNDPKGGRRYGERSMPLADANISVDDVLEFWEKSSFDLGLPVVNGKTIHGNCDLCFLKGGNQILSLIREKPERAVWWAKMESSITNAKIQNGGRFRKDRPSYSQMLNFSQNQMEMFHDEAIPCFCGD